MNFPEKGDHSTEHEKGEKRGSEDAELDKVHSANNWEGANLGDDGRRSKFLRLMGANKKQHSGRFIIGDKSSKHGRSGMEAQRRNDDETSRMTRQLEHQYQSGLDLKLSGAARQHSGLGFQRDDNRPALWSQAPPLSDHHKPDCRDAVDSKPTYPHPEDATASGSKTGDVSGTGPKPGETNGKGDSATPSKSLGLKLNFVKASS